MFILEKILEIFNKIDEYCNLLNNTICKFSFMMVVHVFVVYICIQLTSNILINLYSIDNIDIIYVYILEALLFVICFYFMELFLQFIIKKLKFHILFFKLDYATLNIVYHFFLVISSFIFIILIGIKDSVFSYIFNQYVQSTLNNYEYLKIEYDLFFFTLQSIFACLTYFSNNIRKELHKIENINEH